ncbi:hypothetical protein EMCG_04433 [[Emmonsia] crescens]|uniref:CSC1/OSCA1-like 7TM region domain-containing protein n=1 Tax=[Emmonsia] crescens TaxID=73230 RepID=A0A0G2HT95_9EURO|nr:hypothetical protein EMCG_04433 [Emmonsia crescens UAMH 3008]
MIEESSSLSFLLRSFYRPPSPSDNYIDIWGLDAFFFIRFQLMLLKIFAPLACMTLSLLLPINKIGGKDTNFINKLNGPRWNVTGLDQVAWGNITPQNTDRYWVHLTLAVAMVGYVCFIFHAELQNYVQLKHRYTSGKKYWQSPASTTVLATQIQWEHFKVESFEDFLNTCFNGEIKYVWVNQCYQKLDRDMRIHRHLVDTVELGLTQLTLKKNRLKMRLPLFGLSWMPRLPGFGEEVDMIEYGLEKLYRLQERILAAQANLETIDSAFIQFNTPQAMYTASQAVFSSGFLAQASYVQKQLVWLQGLASLPSWLLPPIQGLISPLIIAVLVATAPSVLECLAHCQGLMTGKAVELCVQKYFFLFLFIQMFLVVSISSSISTVTHSLGDIASIPQILAENIPKASNYFFSYILLQALSVSAGVLVQTKNLYLLYIIAPLRDKTERRRRSRMKSLHEMRWATIFAVHTTFASIGLIYSIITPLITVFSMLAHLLYLAVYNYSMIWFSKSHSDTGGVLFPRAINQLFIAVLLMETCLLGLFLLARDPDGAVACVGQATCMGILLSVSLLYYYWLNMALLPRWLSQPIDISLSDESKQKIKESLAAPVNSRLYCPSDLRRKVIILDIPDKSHVAEDAIKKYNRQYGGDPPVVMILDDREIKKHPSHNKQLFDDSDKKNSDGPKVPPVVYVKRPKWHTVMAHNHIIDTFIEPVTGVSTTKEACLNS